MNKYTAKFQITGTVYKIGEVQTFQSGFTKREVVVNTNDTRLSPISLSLWKEDCEKANGLNIGDEVSVEGSINGREWNGERGTKFFTDLIVRSIMVTNRAAAPDSSQVTDGETLKAFCKAKGIGDDKVLEACSAHKAKVNRKFTAEDWKAVADALCPKTEKPTEAAAPEADSDDLPF